MLWCMRTTLRLDDALVAEVKALAARTGRTMTQVIEDSLRETMARARRPRSSAANKLPTDGRGGLLPGVNLDSNAELLELMEGDAAS